MDGRAVPGSGGESAGGSESGSQRLTYDELIDKIIDQIGFVSSHFGYKEEYVLEHTLEWLNRKAEQAHEEKYSESRKRTIENHKGLMLLVDSLFNQGKNFNELVPTYEETQQKKKVEPKKEEFVGGNWWKSGE